MKYLYLVRLLLLCFVIQACDSRNAVSLNKESITQDTGAGKIVLPNTFTNAEENGFTTHQDTLFFNGTKYSGIVYALNNSADTAFVKSYYDGVEEGLQKKWYPNKQIAEIRWYHLGKKTGKHIGFWENGKPKFEFYFLNGEHEGVAQEWYQNGNPYRLFHYEKGYEQGSQKMWWENGTIRANYEVRNGRRYGLIGLKLCMNQNDTLIKK